MAPPSTQSEAEYSTVYPLPQSRRSRHVEDLPIVFPMVTPWRAMRPYNISAGLLSLRRVSM